MRLQTASSVISLAKELEGESARVYEDLAQRYADGKDMFLSFAKENKKNVVHIERTYYGVITDAIEGCFAFDLESDDYAFKTSLAKDASYSEALGQAVKMEETMVNFYNTAAEQSKSLMADLPRAFMQIVKKRSRRIESLR